ncbi:endonuclease [Chryseobacterium sp. GMJ5]|uniref:Endonuclease n=1 Tax=Chryseobacterium gilvum TaxID=2976534 RepID=A0ABT2W1R9_9FLAO|nr:endonuclease [Chryseobacterium gilvum]MCU7615259.1 endonuclease [Chryseobacterium gilvum]
MELFAFYNVENLFLPDPVPVHHSDPSKSGLRNWDERKYKNKLFKIAHVFQLIKEEAGVLPFMIGLSEISGKKVLEELTGTEPFGSRYGIVHYNSMDERKVDVALLYDQSKIEILHSEAITFFFEIIDENVENYDTTRDVLFTKVKYKEEIINVFVAHLPSKREKDINLPKRTYILSQLREKIINIVNTEKESVILCGDFNENPDEENIKNILYDHNAVQILKNPFQKLYSEENFSAFHYKSGLLFDQIMLSSSLYEKSSALYFDDAGVFKPEKIRSRNKMFSSRPFRTYAGTRYLGGYSDHFPVYIVFNT